MTDDDSPLSSMLGRLRAGDSSARNDLMRHTRDRLHILTRQMLRGFPGVHQWEEASDVVQNVLVRMDRAMKELPIQSVKDFLRLATAQIRRELIDLSRHHFGPQGMGANQAPPGQYNGKSALPEPADSSADPATLIQWHELHSHIAELDDEYRELFDLLYYQGMTQQDASELLDVPLRSLKRRWQKARLKLTAKFGDDFPL